MKSFAFIISLFFLARTSLALNSLLQVSVETLKLMDEETYEINMQRLLQDNSEYIMISNTSAPGEQIDTDKYNLSEYWTEAFSLPNSNLTTECLQLTGNPYFKDFNTYKYILHRLVSLKNNKMYISTSYINLPVLVTYPDKTTALLKMNRLETVVVVYNSSHLWLSSEIRVTRDYPQLPNENVTNFAVLRFQHQYIKIFKESVNLFLETDSTGFYLKIERQRLNVNLTLDYFNYARYRLKFPFDVSNKSETIELKIFAAEGESLEAWVYSPAFPQVFTFVLGRDSISDLRSFDFAFRIWSVNYIASTLMIFTTKKPQSTTEDVLYYLDRYPGSPIDLLRITLLGEFTFLNGFASNEANEIIIEAYQSKFTAGVLVNVLYCMYTYKVESKFAEQTQTMTLYHKAADMKLAGSLFKLDTFWNRESILFLVSTRINMQTAPNAPFKATTSRNGYIVIRDPFLGFANAIYLDPNYNLYTTSTLLDIRVNQYLIMPFGNLFMQNGAAVECVVLKQRLKEYALVIKSKLQGESFYPNFQLLLNNSNKEVFKIYNVQFLRPEKANLMRNFWPTSDSTTITVKSSKQQHGKLLREVVRGSYVVQSMPLLTVSSTFFNYQYLSSEMLGYIQSKSFLRLRHARLQATSALKITSIDFVLGIEVQEGTDDPSMIVFLSSQGSRVMQIFFVKDEKLEKVTEVEFLSPITKVLASKPNQFLLFKKDGSLEYLDAAKYVINILSYPGVNCLDVAYFYHPQLKRSLLCYNLNKGFAFYYIDELITKSLYNIQFRINHSYYPKLTTNSTLYSSSVFPGYFFLFTPRNNQQASFLSVFFADLEERAEIVLIKDISLESLFSDGMGYLVWRVDLVGYRLVVLYRGGPQTNWIGVFKFTEDMSLTFIKKAILNSSLSTDLESELFRLENHFASLFFENADPLLCLKVANSSKKAEKNIILIDPYSPALETFPALILPRHSISTNLTVFPVYRYGSDNVVKSSVGLLHFSPEIIVEDLENQEKKFLFQFVTPGQPTIFLDSDSFKEITPSSILFTAGESNATTYDICLEDHLALSSPSRSANSLNFTMKLEVVASSSNETDSVSLGNVDLDRKMHYEEFKQKKDVVVYSSRFTSFLKKTVIDWSFEEESIFDSVLKSIVANPPMKVVSWQNNINWTGLKEYDSFCYRFKQVGSTTECVKQGLAFYFNDSVGVLYETTINKANLSSVLRVPTIGEECSGYFTMGYMLLTICKIGYSKFMVVTNMLTLEQFFYPHLAFTSMNLKSSENNKFSSSAISFVILNQRSKDMYNRVVVGSSYTFVFNWKILNPPSFTKFGSYLSLVGDKVFGMFSDYLAAVIYLENHNSYLVTQIALLTGNQVVLWLSVELMEIVDARNIGEQSTSTTTPLGLRLDPRKEKLRFTVDGSVAVKQTALSNTYLKVLTFDFNEMTYRGTKSDFSNLDLSYEQNIYTNLLIYLPNYHSYMFRYQNYMQKCLSSLYKLYNPFAGFENDFVSQKPVCQNWACIFGFKGKEDYYYLLLYDMKYEWIRQQRNNFEVIFKSYNFSCIEDKSDIHFSLDIIGENYTIYPLQILKVQNLQLVVMDKTYRKETDPEEMAATIFYKNSTFSQIIINRNLKVTMNSLYVSSYYVDAQIKELRGAIRHLRMDVLPFREADYVKYYFFIFFCISLACLYQICAYWQLRKQESEKIKDFELHFHEKKKRHKKEVASDIEASIHPLEIDHQNEVQTAELEENIDTKT